MNISIHSHEQWEALTAAGSLMPNYLGENDEFVFAGTGSQDAPSDLMELRADVETVLSSFTILY